MTTPTTDPSPQRAAGVPAQPGEIDGAMRTGQGADDEPETTIGDRHAGEALPDADGDGRLDRDEAEALLSGQAVDRTAPAGTPPTTE